MFKISMFIRFPYSFIHAPQFPQRIYLWFFPIQFNGSYQLDGCKSIWILRFRWGYSCIKVPVHQISLTPSCMPLNCHHLFYLWFFAIQFNRPYQLDGWFAWMRPWKQFSAWGFFFFFIYNKVKIKLNGVESTRWPPSFAEWDWISEQSLSTRVC